jgi:hypothetical protein
MYYRSSTVAEQQYVCDVAAVDFFLKGLQGLSVQYFPETPGGVVVAPERGVFLFEFV